MQTITIANLKQTQHTLYRVPDWFLCYHRLRGYRRWQNLSFQSFYATWRWLLGSTYVDKQGKKRKRLVVKYIHYFRSDGIPVYFSSQDVKQGRQLVEQLWEEVKCNHVQILYLHHQRKRK